MTLANKVQQFNDDADIAHEIIHGDASTTVETENGPVRSFAKVLADFVTSIGSSLIGFIHAGTGAVSRTVQSKLRDTVSVKDFGADPSGATSSLDAFTAAYDAVSAGGHIQVPYGDYSGVSGVLTGTKFVVWEIEGSPNGGGLWNLPGIVKQGFTTREITAIQQTVADGDLKNSFVRNTSHSGGTPGFVCTNMSITTTVGAAVTNFEWGWLSVLNNYASAGENVSAYMQANRYGTGPTWAAVQEVIDRTNLADPTSGAVACEVDVRANGTDANNNRIGTHYVVGQAFTGGANVACEAYAAVVVDARNVAGDVGSFNYGAVIKSAKQAGIHMQQTGLMGLDTSAATFNDVTVPNMAIRMAAGQRINFNSSSARTLRYEPAVGALRYASGATLFEVYDDGSANLTSNLKITTVGAGLRVKEGSNAKQGTATLTAGTVTVSNASVTANSRIFLTSQADGGTPGYLRVSARVAGTSFTITSSSGTDTSTVAYQIFEPA
jgi:hypothetical protein